MRKTILGWSGIGFLVSMSVFASLDPSGVRTALGKKTETYIKEGVFVGGHRGAQQVFVKDIRRATNTSFERIVVDLESPQIPYYQVSVEPVDRRIVLSLFGGAQTTFDAKKIAAQFKKSPLVSRVDLFPKLEGDAWVLALQLKAAVPVEVFELGSPSRIIFDLKGGEGLLREMSPPVRAAVKAPRASRVRPAKKKEALPFSLEEESGNGASGSDEEIPE